MDHLYSVHLRYGEPTALDTRRLSATSPSVQSADRSIASNLSRMTADPRLQVLKDGPTVSRVDGPQGYSKSEDF